MKFTDIYIKNQKDLEEAVDALGFVPFFTNSVAGFSIKERIDPAAWFPDEGEGIWEWKGPVIRNTGCAYGKFFEKKAVFISKEWFPDFANLRRGGLTFEEMYDFGLIPYTHKVLYDVLRQRAPVTSAELKYVPTTTVPVDSENAEKLEKLLDAIDELDDVTAVHTNAE